MKFYDRENELEMLGNLPKGTNLVVVYGRRRIGKTRLILEHLKGKDYRYVFIPSNIGLSMFLKEVTRTQGIPEFASLDSAIEYLMHNSENIFFDEFQNFKYLDPAIFSHLQRMIDDMDFRGKQINIFVAGSSNSMMRDIFMGYSRPLYGRAKAFIKLGPLPIGAVMEMLDDKGIRDFRDKMRYYSVFGGIPKYYEYIRKRNFEEQLKEMFFMETSPLREEGKIVLLSEFGGEFSTYFSILDAIANGNRKLGDMASALGMKSTSLNKYLDILRKDYGMVRRIVPATEDPRKSKRGMYVLDDMFLSFWFRFVKRYESYYEQGMENIAFEEFMRDFPSHISFVFEDVVRNLIKGEGKWHRVGSWWNRKGYEIDIVALNESKKEILFGEVKWRNRPIGWNVVEELMEKKELVEWNKDNRNERFLVVSKSRFTKRCLERMDSERIMHWDLKDVESMLKRRG